MTNSEYEKMFGVQNNKVDHDQKTDKEDTGTVEQQDNVSQQQIKKIQDSSKLEPISLGMLKGAFLVLLAGNVLATIVLIFERIEYKYHCFEKIGFKWNKNVRQWKKIIRRLRRHIIHLIHSNE